MNKFLVIVSCLASLVSARPDVSLGYHYDPNYNSGAELLSAPFTSGSSVGAASSSSVDFLAPSYSVAGVSSGDSSGFSNLGSSSSGSSGSGLITSGGSGSISSGGSGYSGGSGFSSGGSGYSGGSSLSSSGGLGFSSGSGLSNTAGLGFGSGGFSSGFGSGYNGGFGSGYSGGLGSGYSGGLGSGYGGGFGYNSGLGASGYNSGSLGLGSSNSGYNTIGLGSGLSSGVAQGFSGGVNQGYSGGVNSLGLSSGGVGQYAANFPPQLPPLVTKNFYVHSAPEDHDDQQIVRYVTIGRPLKNYRVVFINAPSSTSTRAKIIANVAPVEDRTAIYVLSKKTNDLDISADVVTPAPTAPSKPDVFFIKYKTPQEAIHAQHVVQAQYEQLGGSSNYANAGIIPVQSVIGHLNAGGSAVVSNANAQGVQGTTQFITQGGGAQDSSQFFSQGSGGQGSSQFLTQGGGLQGGQGSSQFLTQGGGLQGGQGTSQFLTQGSGLQGAQGSSQFLTQGSSSQGLQGTTQFLTQGSGDLVNNSLLPDQSQFDQVATTGDRVQSKYLPPRKYKKY